jgi:prepilin-type N-terminal cleavage/methylation domain-containing protein
VGQPRPTPRARTREDGFTLIELLITASILSVVLLAILARLDTSARIAPQEQERASAIQESQVGLHRMTTEVRQAYEVVNGDADTLTIRVLPRGTSTPVVVTWECAAAHPIDSALRRCTRTVGAGTPELVIDRVVNGASRPVFEYDATPTAARYIRTSVIVPARGDRKEGLGHKHEIVLADGIYLRNRDA